MSAPQASIIPIKSTSGALKVLSLTLDDQLFALEASCVREILDVPPVTQVPAAGPFAGGLINVRGKVVPLADLRYPLGMERRAASIDTRIVVIEIDLGGDLTTVAIVADKVHEVAEIPHASIEETPKIGMAWRPEFIRCIGKRADDFVTVLDIARIFSSTVPEKKSSSSIAAQRVLAPNSMH
jgi:purine-binding chemotaxis protein CheW